MATENRQTEAAAAESSALLSQLPQGGKHCRVEHWVAKNMMFVACKKLVYCPHQLDFGGGCACTNPVRHELYNRFGI